MAFNRYVLNAFLVPELTGHPEVSQVGLTQKSPSLEWLMDRTQLNFKSGGPGMKSRPQQRLVETQEREKFCLKMGVAGVGGGGDH